MLFLVKLTLLSTLPFSFVVDNDVSTLPSEKVNNGNGESTPFKLDTLLLICVPCDGCWLVEACCPAEVEVVEVDDDVESWSSNF